MKIRALRADEIELRVGSTSPKGTGFSLLCYKDARCDQNILDETFGPMNWQRHHSRDNANCIISIWDEEKKQWVEKEDTGAESFTEKEKGLASDSFKRAGFNWGIGRELYTSPFIWINGHVEKNAKGKMEADKKFVAGLRVTEIEYEEVESKRTVSKLVIKDKDNVVVYSYGKSGMPKKAVDRDAVIKTILACAEAKGIEIGTIVKGGDVTKLSDKKLEECLKYIKGL